MMAEVHEEASFTGLLAEHRAATSSRPYHENAEAIFRSRCNRPPAHPDENIVFWQQTLQAKLASVTDSVHRMNVLAPSRSCWFSLRGERHAITRQ